MTKLIYQSPHLSAGFTAVELMIALFIAAIFLFAGYSMYNTTVDYSVDAQNRAQADRIAYDYLQRYQASVGATCGATTPLNHASLASNVNATGMVSPTITVQISCPLSTIPSLSKVVAHVEYKTGVTLNTVEQEVYASQ